MPSFTWLASIPADNDTTDEKSWFKYGWQVLRHLKTIRTIMEVDHYWRDADKGGYHKHLTFLDDEGGHLYGKATTRGVEPHFLSNGIPTTPFREREYCIIRNSSKASGGAGLILDRVVTMDDETFALDPIPYVSPPGAGPYGAIKFLKTGLYAIHMTHPYTVSFTDYIFRYNGYIYNIAATKSITSNYSRGYHIVTQAGNSFALYSFAALNDDDVIVTIMRLA
jgi:hypothetical protein